MRASSRAAAVWLLILSAWAGGYSSPAYATFHDWKIDEVYSNASGSVQYVEFLLPSFVLDDERFVSGQSLAESVLGHNYTFPTPLPSKPVANQHFLVATPGYAALPGVPAPDYILPSDNFFSMAGDTLTYAGGLDSLTWSAGQLPTDGTNSIQRAYGAPTFTTGTNSPTNFAGQTGTVPEPGSMAVMAGLALFGISRRRRA